MTLDDFNALPRVPQLLHLLDQGIYLARRWQDGHIFSLYHLPSGFFAELHHDRSSNEILRVQAFTGAAPLDAYAAAVQLPDEWT